ncbi:MAG: T9SS type A sorting domain-containing protein [Flavobacteriales bacterium]
MKKKILFLLSFIFIFGTSFSQNPSNLTVDSTTANSATVSWQNGGCNTNNYILSYKNNNLSNWDSIIVSNSNFLSSYTISSINANTTYNWRVKCDTSGSTYSSGSNFTTSSCFSFSYLVTDASCDGNNDGAIDLTIGGGISPLNYSWSSPQYTWFNDSTEDISNLLSGEYHISVIDTILFGGCTQIDTISVAIIDSHSINQITSNFTINPLTSYGVWTNTSLTLENTGCDVNLRPEFNISHDSLSIMHGDFDLQWLNPLTSNFVPFNYSIDNSGNAFGFWHYTNNSNQNQNPDSTGIIVNEGATQILSIRVRFNNTPSNTANYGLYSCIWNTQEVDSLGNIIQTLAPADTLNLSFLNCSSFSIDSLLISHVSCYGSNDGNASFSSISGGSGNYSYLWSNGDTSSTASNLYAGNYNLIITDIQSGCQVSNTFSVIEPNPSILTIQVLDSVNCFGENNGALVANITGGIPPYTYNWTNDVNSDTLNTDTITNLISATYSCTVTDSNNCITTSTFNLTEPTEIIISQNNTNITCHGDTNGIAILSISGGNGNYILDAFGFTLPLLGNNTISSSQFFPNGIPAGQYPFSVTDGNGCIKNDTIIIFQPDPLSAIITSNNISCYGLTDGNISLNISGGTAPYLENWYGFNPNFLSEGTYFFSVIDSNNCILSDSVSIIEPDSLYLNTNYNNISCFGLNDGNASITIFGGVPSYTENWGNSNPLALSPGIHYFTISDTNGCSISDSIFITQPDSLIVLNTSSDATCFGGNNGFAVLSISGGTSPYFQNWYGYDPLALYAGTYIFTVTDTNNCSVTDSVVILQSQDSLTSLLSVVNLSSCSINDGSINQVINGGISPYTYLWNNGDTTKNISNLSAGNYSVTITDVNGCFTTQNAFVDQPSDSLRLSLSTSDFNGYSLACYGDSNGIISASTTGGNGSVSFQWSNGDSSSTINNLSSGNYIVSITDTSGCSLTDSLNLTSPNEFISSYTSSNVLCFGDSTGSATVNFSGGVTDYILGWGGFTLPLLSGQNIFNSGAIIPAGIYPYNAVDQNGCTLYDTIIITQPDSLFTSYTISDYNGYNISCYSSNDGEINLSVFGGNSPYFIYFNNLQYPGPNTLITGLNQGTYLDSITDSNGCLFMENITINEPPRLASYIQLLNNSSCYNACDGSLAALVDGGISPYNYIWNNDSLLISDTVTNLCSGTYILIAQDLNGCQASSLDSINQPNQIPIFLDSITNNTIYGGNTGNIFITLINQSSSTSFNWTGPNGFTSNNEDISNLLAGTYVLNTIDSLACSLDTFIVEQPLSLSASLDYTINNICWGRNQGAIAITPDGGDSIYTYLWTGPNGFSSTDQDIDSLYSGTYTLYLSDSTNTISYDFNVLENDEIIIFSNGATAECYDGSAFATAYGFGGTPPLSTYWSNGDTGVSTTLVVGTHAVTVIDVYGCNSTDSVTIEAGDSLSITTNNTNITCFGLNDGIVSLTVYNGGMAPYQYSNDGGLTYQSSNTFYNLSTGNYTFTVTDFNGCTNEISTIINEPLELGVDVIITNLLCFNDCDATATAIVNNGNQPYSYLWSDPGQQQNQTAVGLCSGTYNVIVNDVNGCVATEFINITNPDPIIVNILQNDGTLEATTGFISYQWLDDQLNPITGDTSNIFTPNQSGEYSVEVTDSNGCSITSYSVSFNYSGVQHNNTYILNIYPNPTSDFIYIEQASKISEVEIFNSLGDKVLHHLNEMSANQLKFNLSDKTRGIYFVKIISENKPINYKIVLQ